MKGTTMRLQQLRSWSRKIFLLCFVGGLYLVAVDRLRGTDGRERGDVPGWVMVTLMTALLVVALLAIAGPALTNMFNDAINKVGG